MLEPTPAARDARKKGFPYVRSHTNKLLVRSAERESAQTDKNNLLPAPSLLSSSLPHRETFHPRSTMKGNCYEGQSIFSRT